MIYLSFAALALLALAPLGWSLLRRGAGRGARESALAVYRAQLAELERERAEGRLGAPEFDAARLEVQRRLLATADTAETGPARASRAPLLATLLLVPIAGAGLYLIAGKPDLPAEPLAERVAQADRDPQQTDAMIAKLRSVIATLEPTSEKARQGLLLLGNAEDSRGRLPEAAMAWRQAVAIRFDPDLAALTAEAQTRISGRVSDDSAFLFRRALVEGKPDAPWRKLVEARLAEAGK